MKKLLLMATLGVAGLVSAKGAVENTFDKNNKEVKEHPVQLCGVTVTYYGADGNISSVEMFTSDQPNLMSCIIWQQSKIRSVQSQGYSVDVN